MSDNDEGSKTPDESDWMPEGLTQPPIWREGFDNPSLPSEQDLEAAIATQQQFIDAMEKHLATVTDPAMRTTIEDRIAAHQATMQYLERQLHNV